MVSHPGSHNAYAPRRPPPVIFNSTLDQVKHFLFRCTTTSYRPNVTEVSRVSGPVATEATAIINATLKHRVCRTICRDKPADATS